MRSRVDAASGVVAAVVVFAVLVASLLSWQFVSHLL